MCLKQRVLSAVHHGGPPHALLVPGNWFMLEKNQSTDVSPQNTMLAFANQHFPDGLRVKWQTVDTRPGSPDKKVRHAYGVVELEYLFKLIAGVYTRALPTPTPSKMSFYEIIEQRKPARLYFDVEIDGYPLRPTSGDHLAVLESIHASVVDRFHQLGWFENMDTC